MAHFEDDHSIKPLEDSMRIKDFFKGKDVFITGATGFIGKVVLEKILRACPEVNQIFLLLRPKKGDSIETRLRKMLDAELFSKLNKQDSNVIRKLVPLAGDVSSPGLGLDEESRARVLSSQVVLHVAASVRFDDKLQSAVEQNLRSTRDLLDLALEMRDIKAFIYVSTAYSSCYRLDVEEVVYPADVNWRELIEMTEKLKPSELEAQTKNLLGKHPNTYTFTKHLAENAVNDYRDKLPVLIFRPSIVTVTVEDPFPGWIDNLNGPVGPCLGVITGVVRVMYMDPDMDSDMIPCDVVVNMLIIATWYRGSIADKVCPVVNSVNGGKIPCPYSNLTALTDEIMETSPPALSLWYPFITFTTNRVWYLMLVFVLHIIPGAIVELMLKLSGAKFSIMRVYKKIFRANEELFYFTTREWKFSTGNFDKLLIFLKKEDREVFSIDYYKYTPHDVVRIAWTGCKKYILKERDDEETHKKAKKRASILYWLHLFSLGMAMCGAAWLIMKLINPLLILF